MQTAAQLSPKLRLRGGAAWPNQSATTGNVEGSGLFEKQWSMSP